MHRKQEKKLWPYYLKSFFHCLVYCSTASPQLRNHTALDPSEHSVLLLFELEVLALNIYHISKGRTFYQGYEDLKA